MGGVDHRFGWVGKSALCIITQYMRASRGNIGLQLQGKADGWTKSWDVTDDFNQELPRAKIALSARGFLVPNRGVRDPNNQIVVVVVLGSRRRSSRSRTTSYVVSCTGLGQVQASFARTIWCINTLLLLSHGRKRPWYGICSSLENPADAWLPFTSCWIQEELQRHIILRSAN